MRQAAGDLKAIRSTLIGRHYVQLAEAYAKAGDIGQAHALLDEALATTRSRGDRYFEAEILRRKGETLLMRELEDRQAAERCFREAIELARQQAAKSWELRATTSLARLLRNTDRRDEARAMLADIYGWFTEGFDTADLRDAKALLDDLSA